MWEFDESVASRFQKEAITHIPDYERVIDTCIDIADSLKIPKSSTIVDVGSAAGHTVNRFITHGYTNTFGVESSQKMRDKSLCKDNIILSDKFPDIQCEFVMANWTLHFIKQRKEYIQSIYDNLSGVLVLTDKTTQTNVTKMLYYKWKLDNGVDPSYILQKEKDLTGVLTTYDAGWYIDTLKRVGFPRVEIINSRFGFTTFYCEKA